MKHPNILAMASAASSAAALPVLPRALRATMGMGLSGIRADAPTPQAMFEELNRTLASMRGEIDASKKEDGLVTAKVDKMNEHIGNLQTALQSVQEAVQTQQAPENVIGDIPGDPAYVRTFNSFMRRGEDDNVEVRAALRARVDAAMQMGSQADGGFLAPIEWDRSITQQLLTAPSIRPYADSITITGQGFKRLVAVGRPGSGWVGETAARPQTSTPTFAEVTFGIGEIYANPAITQTALDDAAIDLEAWLGNSVRSEFSRQENIAFLSGDGVNKPFGLLGYVEGGAHDTRHPLGAIEALVTAGNLATGVVSDDLLNVIYDLPAERSANARWFMNRTTEAGLRKLKDTTGNYIWQPRITEKEPSTLHGYQIVHIPGMPVSGANGVDRKSVV